MAKRIGATVKAMQAAGFQGASNCAGGVAQTDQLGVRDNPVLVSSQVPQLPVVSYFFPHTGDKCDSDQVLPP